MSAAHTFGPAPHSTHPSDRPASRRLALAGASTLAVVVALLAWGPASAWAWGRLGHKLAGQIAEDRLTPNARKAIHELLEPGESLATVSSWADEVRKDRRESSSWHYVNVPISEERYDRKFEDAKGGVVSKVVAFQRIVGDRNAPRVERQEALKFLAHFVEDMHQPVHVGHRGDRGGNDLQVQFFGKGSNLHSVWDSGLLEHAHRPDADYAQALAGRITPELAARWSQGTVEDWANESLNAAKGAYTHPGAPGQIKSGVKLGDPYYEANLPTAELRIEQAGVRLAALLNAIFP